MKDAIRLALHREAVGPDGNKTKRLNIVAAKLVELACDGDISAIKEINDRIDGKSIQQVKHSNDGDEPLSMVHTIERVIVRSNSQD